MLQIVFVRVVAPARNVAFVLPSAAFETILTTLAGKLGALFRRQLRLLSRPRSLFEYFAKRLPSGLLEDLQHAHWIFLDQADRSRNTVEHLRERG